MSNATNEAGISFCQEVDAGLGRVDAQQQRVEVQSITLDDDDLAVNDATAGRVRL